jgi:hypothetical protein
VIDRGWGAFFQSAATTFPDPVPKVIFNLCITLSNVVCLPMPNGNELPEPPRSQNLLSSDLCAIVNEPETG